MELYITCFGLGCLAYNTDRIDLTKVMHQDCVRGQSNMKLDHNHLMKDFCAQKHVKKCTHIDFNDKSTSVIIWLNRSADDNSRMILFSVYSLRVLKTATTRF